MKLGDMAVLRDKHDHEYTDEALFLALLLKAKGKDRDAEKDIVGKLLDDVNQKPIKK